MISYFFLVFAKYFPIKTKNCKELGGQQNLLKNEEKGEKTKPNPLQHMVTEHTNGDEDEKGGKTHPLLLDAKVVRCDSSICPSFCFLLDICFRSLALGFVCFHFLWVSFDFHFPHLLCFFPSMFTQFFVCFAESIKTPRK